MSKKHEIYHQFVQALAEAKYEQELDSILENRAKCGFIPQEIPPKDDFIKQQAAEFGDKQTLKSLFTFHTLKTLLPDLEKKFGICPQIEDCLCEIVDEIWKVQHNKAISNILQQVEEWEIAPVELFPFLGGDNEFFIL